MERKNIFDLVRLFAAFAVMYSHHFAFSGYDEPRVFGITKLGTFAVIIFFSISGYLVTFSYIRSKSPINYMLKRVKRIFPALIVCSFFMVYIICSIFGKGNALDYIKSSGAALTFLNYSLLGSKPIDINGFASTYIHSNSLNGSLWSLSYEFSAYIFLMVALFIKKHRLITTSLIVIVCTLILVFIQNELIPSQIIKIVRVNLGEASTVARACLFFIPFFIGSVMATLKEKWNSSSCKILLICISMVMISVFSESYEMDIIFYLFSPIIILSACTLLNDKIINGKFDISYGVYIYACPIQQITINNLGLSFYGSLLLSVVIVIILSSLSWVFIEKPFLRSHAVRAPTRDTVNMS